MSVHPGSVLAAALVTLAFLVWFPAPEGCGCAGRKRALQRLGVRVFA